MWATDTIVEIDKSNKKIRRKPDTKIPVANQEYLNQVKQCTVLCEGFPKSASVDDFIDFAATFGDKIITRIVPQRSECRELTGSVFLTFCSKERAERFMNFSKSIEFHGIKLKLTCKWENDLEKNE